MLNAIAYGRQYLYIFIMKKIPFNFALFYVLLLSVILIACENQSIEKMNFEEDGLKVVYKGKQPRVSLEYIISYRGITLHSENVFLLNEEEKTLPLLKKQEAFDKVDTIAYTCAHTGVLDFHYILKSKDEILADSTKVLAIPNLFSKNNSSSKFAQLLTNGYGTIKHGDYFQYSQQAKSFLVRNKIRKADDFIERMAYVIYIILNNGHENLYELSEVRKVKEMPNEPIVVHTNMDYDYFYLLAVNNENNLKTFAESEIVNGFKQGKKSQVIGDKYLTLVPVLYNSYASGEISLFLLGINENWDYDYYPIGGIIIDNVAPILLWEDPALQLFSINTYPVHGTLEKFKDYYIKFPTSLYQSRIKNVTWGNFEGNNYWGYPIVFTVNIAEIGDLSSVILQGKRYRIDLSEAFRKKTFVFEHRIPRLNVGDNYVTIQFEDRMGNVSSGKINIATESIRNDDN